MDEQTAAALAEIRNSFDRHTRITVLTGAGVSAASGIPTFRGGADSLWENHRPEELATAEAFDRDPELVWRWYDWRRQRIADSSPNAAHEALARLAEATQVKIVTQNVDGLHQKAGSGDVLEFHGSIWNLRCTSCRAEATDMRAPLPLLPRCEGCGGLLRPGVVWFGESIDPAALTAASAAARGCDHLLVIGTSGAVYPAAGLVAVARDSGANVIEFNVEPSAITHQVHLFVPGSAADTVPLINP